MAQPRPDGGLPARMASRSLASRKLGSVRLHPLTKSCFLRVDALDPFAGGHEQRVRAQATSERVELAHEELPGMPRQLDVRMQLTLFAKHAQRIVGQRGMVRVTHHGWARIRY